MAYLSICSTVGANTGGIDCDRKRGQPVRAFIGSKQFTAAEYASEETFLAALQEAINLPAGSPNKLFPIGDFQGNTNNTEQNTTGTLGYGLNIVLREGRPAYELQLLAGQTQFAKIRAFNGSTLPVFMLDNNGAIWGTKLSNGNFKGEDAQIFISGNGFEDGNTVELKTATVTFSYTSAQDFYQNAGYMQVTFASADVQGLVDVSLASVGVVGATTKFSVIAKTAQLNGGVNIYDTYKTPLAAMANWKAFTGTNFATTVDITGVVANDSDKTWSVTFDATDYAAITTGQQIKVMLADPATLNAANVPGIESIPVIIVKP